MRFKVAPAPVDLPLLETVHDALPLVPEPEADCCARVVDRTDVPGRDDAREWIAFLEALELVEETPRGFQRLRSEVGPAPLADAYVQRVFGASELLDGLAESGPLDTDDAFDHLRPHVPEWERDRHADWEAEWRERTRRLLRWCEAFDLAVSEDGRFRATDTRYPIG